MKSAGRGWEYEPVEGGGAEMVLVVCWGLWKNNWIAKVGGGGGRGLDVLLPITTL